MNFNRRNFLRRTTLLGAGLAATQTASAQQHLHQEAKPPAPQSSQMKAPSQPDTLNQPASFQPVYAPDLPKLPYKLEDGAKVFHLTAEPVRAEFLPAASWADARVADVWGYNGQMPGPTIEVQEGDRVRIHFTNKLPEPTAPHWHGLEVPPLQDGVPGIGQPLIMPGETHTYEFMLHQHGTFFYHSHMPMQEMMGMIGLFIVHPRQPQHSAGGRVDKDFAIIMQEWAILPNNTVPNTMAMEFNWLTFNGKAGPACTPMIVRHGERVRIRLVNLGMDHHPIHIHGNQFYVTGTEGGRIPESAWYPGNTVLVGVAQARDIEFEAKTIGDWMLHCHLPHHMMNQMVTMVGQDSAGPHAAHQDKTAVAAKRRVPGYPQDMWMTMDAEVAKPETSWLPEGWTGSMMGMMTLVRVLPPEQYDRMMALIKEGKYEPGPKWPTKQEPHHHGE
jgi:FtsP/CotA-like multicopper oxidase with cupredoxin domain